MSFLKFGNIHEIKWIKNIKIVNIIKYGQSAHNLLVL